MKTKHTPGPWFARIEDIELGSHVSISNGKTWDIKNLWIGEANGSNVGPENIKETIANANLMAASPELLEALVLCVEQFKDIIGSTENKKDAIAIKKAIKAIKKATK